MIVEFFDMILLIQDGFELCYRRLQPTSSARSPEFLSPYQSHANPFTRSPASWADSLMAMHSETIISRTAAILEKS